MHLRSARGALGAEVGIRLGSGAGPAREAALAAALRRDDVPLDRRKDLAAEEAAAAIAAGGEAGGCCALRCGGRRDRREECGDGERCQ